jgi:hypothetical protein
MGWFRKKNDPISEKARALEGEIQALEAEIKRLAEEAAKPQPKFRSSAVPRRAAEQSPAPAPLPPAHDFDVVDQSRLKKPADPAASEHYNDLGLRKYDLVGAWARFKNNFRGPSASNPKLVNYLAAGSIQGLRPLRYEKRVARNRFIFLVIVLVLVLWGILAVIFRR